LVNDGSVDRCRQICDEYAAVDDRIIVIHKENEGVSVARNVGIECSSGQWICFVDSDDWVEPNMCEDAIKHAEINNLDMLAYNTYSNFSNNQIKCADITQCIFDSMEITSFQLCLVSPLYFNSRHMTPIGDIGGCHKKIYSGDMLRKADVRFIQGLPRGEDIVFNLQISKFFKRIGFINEFWYHYRTHKNQTTQAYHANLLDATLMYFKTLSEYIDIQYKDSKESEAAFNLSAVRALNRMCIQFYFHKNNPSRLSVRLRELKNAIMTEPFNRALQIADTSCFRLDDRLFSFFLRKRMILSTWILTKVWLALYAVTRGKV
jgi:glycosyltransferase involved in cell wall biosynthesis